MTILEDALARAAGNWSGDDRVHMHTDATLFASAIEREMNIEIPPRPEDVRDDVRQISQTLHARTAWTCGQCGRSWRIGVNSCRNCVR